MTTDAAPQPIEDLFKLTLVDGLKAKAGDRDISYRVVRLRETGVAHERAATRLAERVVHIDGAPKLLVSETDFRYAMTMMHIETFVCDGQTLPAAMIDLDLVGRLSSHDWGLIEARILLIELAAQVRYGTITQEAFDLVLSGGAPKQTPQPVGQAAELGSAAAASQPGPALLADFAGGGAAGPAVGDGR